MGLFCLHLNHSTFILKKAGNWECRTLIKKMQQDLFSFFVFYKCHIKLKNIPLALDVLMKSVLLHYAECVKHRTVAANKAAWLWIVYF